MTWGSWIAMTLSLIVAGYGGIRGYERWQSRRLDRKWPERK